MRLLPNFKSLEKRKKRGDDNATTEYFCFLRLPIRYEELCDFLTSQVPSLKVLNKINFSDGLFLPDEKVAQFFPCSEHLDDAYHMVNINCVQHCPVNELVHMKPLVWKMVKTYNEIEFYESAEALSTLCPTFYSRYWWLYHRKGFLHIDKYIGKEIWKMHDFLSSKKNDDSILQSWTLCNCSNLRNRMWNKYHTFRDSQHHWYLDIFS